MPFGTARRPSAPESGALAEGEASFMNFSVRANTVSRRGRLRYTLRRQPQAPQEQDTPSVPLHHDPNAIVTMTELQQAFENMSQERLSDATRQAGENSKNAAPTSAPPFGSPPPLPPPHRPALAVIHDKDERRRSLSMPIMLADDADLANDAFEEDDNDHASDPFLLANHSDTAGLVDHAAPMGGRSSIDERKKIQPWQPKRNASTNAVPLRPIYQPAPIHDLTPNPSVSTLRMARTLAKSIKHTIQTVARRVINVQNANVASFIFHHHHPKVDSASSHPASNHSDPSLHPNSTKRTRNTPIRLVGNTCAYFTPENPLRTALARLFVWRWMETIAMLVLVLHGLVLLVVGQASTPTTQPPTSFGQSWDQYIILAVFVFHTWFLLARIVVFGFVWRRKPRLYDAERDGPLPFLRHSWNRVDLIAVVSYWVHFGLQVAQQEIVGDHQRILVFKMLSALILLRLLNITKGNTVILHSLKKAGPLVAKVAFFVLFFVIIFASIGVQSFKGSFLRHCTWQDPTNSTNIEELDQYCGAYLDGDGTRVPFLKSDGSPSEWSKGFTCGTGLQCKETANPYAGTLSMDNIFGSMLVVLVITGNQTWTDLMYSMMDAEYFVACLYFIIIVIVMNFWLLNLFVAVINEMFAKVREDSQHSAFTTSKAAASLADTEGDWSFGRQDEKRAAATPDRPQPALTRLILRARPLWVLLVIVDLVFLAIKNNGMTVQQLAFYDYMEFVFSMAFFAEIVLRWMASWSDLGQFFRDKTNRADMVIAFMTCLIWIPPIRNNPMAFAWLSGFQVLRIYRVILAIPRLRNLFSRVLGTVWGLINLIFFIIMCTLIGAIIAFQLLQGSLQDAEDAMQFFSIYNSFIALNQLFSGENWTTVLYDAMQYGAPSGNAAINALFLSLWFACSNFVMVNMIIAILMENFDTAEEEKRQRQVAQYAQTNNHSVHDNTDAIVSRWNIYRYLTPQPTQATTTQMPSNLVLPLPKSDIKQFLKEWQPDEDMRAKYQQQQQQHRKHMKKRSDWRRRLGPLYTIGQFMQEHLARLNHASVLANGGQHGGRIDFSTTYDRGRGFDGHPSSLSTTTSTTSMMDPGMPPFDTNQTTFEQLNTFYDISKSTRNTDDRSTSLRYILAPSLRVNIAASVEEATLHDIEERRAMHRDFLRAHPAYDRSLFLFHPHHWLRYACQRLVPASHGERTFGTQPSFWAKTLFLSLITLCVLTNVILTIYNNPVMVLEHTRQNDTAPLKRVAYADWVFTFVFSVEFVIKIIADGFLLTPNAYMLNGWNVLDVFVLLTLYLSNFGHFAASTGLERVFRAFKALRALRLINLLASAKHIFTVVLIQGLPLILDAATLGLFLIVPFALYGKQVFMGLFFTCNDSTAANKMACTFETMLATTTPMPSSTQILAPRVWTNPYVYSFDSFWSSLLILFEIASGEGWTDVLETSMSLVGKDQSQQPFASQWAGIFFMVYNLAGSIFVISLFLGIILENFARRNGTAYLTLDQRRWLDLRKLLGSITPAKRPVRIPTRGIRKMCFDLVEDKRGKFYKVLTCVILFNIVLLCTDTYGSDDMEWLRDLKAFFYLALVLFYWVEIAIKWLGLGYHSFRQNLWNLFDFVATLGATVSIIFTLAMDQHHVNVESQKLFLTALCFKLVQRNDALHQLFTTMAASSYQIINVYAVWLVVMLTYAIMFMEIFGLTKYGTVATTEHVNFRSFANTLVSLIRYSSGEGWNQAMHDFTVEAPRCVAAENYLDSDCGSTAWAYFLFLSFNVISMYIFTAIFVAVVADNFSYVYQVASNFTLVNRDEIRKFKKCWADFDCERTGYIRGKDYMSFWRKLDGMFSIKVYDDAFSYKNLVTTCSAPPRADQDPSDLYKVRVDLHHLRRRLADLDPQAIHKRKQDLNKIYWETAMTETARGIAFNDMLLMLAQQKLIVPENALLLEELLFNQKKMDAINTLISIDRVKGMMETIALRKKFLQHLRTKHPRNTTPPAVHVHVADPGAMSPSMLSPLGHESPLMSPGLPGYMSDDSDVDHTNSTFSLVAGSEAIAESAETSVWKDLLARELHQ